MSCFHLLFPVLILQVAGFVADAGGFVCWGQARGLCTFRDQKKIIPLPLNRLKCKLLYEVFVSAHRDYSYTRVSGETRGHLDPASSSIPAIKKHKCSPSTHA